MASNPNWIASPDELASAPRNTVHAMIEGLIQWLDQQDGDPDIEDHGLEDSFLPHRPNGPGCPIADEDGPAWTERVAQHRNDRRHPTFGGWHLGEDDEDDDPSGGTGLEDEFDTRIRGYSGAGCPIADPGGCEHDGREEEHEL